MPLAKIYKLIALPDTPEPNAIYLIPKDTTCMTIAVTGIDGSVKTIDGYTNSEIEEICLNVQIQQLTSTFNGEVSIGDSLEQAISKLQGQATLFGQGADADAVFSVTQFTSVPTEFKSIYIIVTQPHMRMMVWNGAKYVRAPWHRPGIVTFSYMNHSIMDGYLPVRGDITYNQANYPDLVELLGLTGTGTFSLVEARGEFLRVLDNGRGIDVSRTLRSAQYGTLVPGYDDNGEAGNISVLPNKGGRSYNSDKFILEDHPELDYTRYLAWSTTPTVAVIDRSYGGGFYAVARPRNIALPLWVSY